MYEFKGKVWKDPAANWYFVSLDQKLTDEIKANPNSKTNEYGLIKAEATVGKTSWKTTLFPTKNGNLVFAIKADIRKKENIQDGDTLNIKITLN